MMIFAGEVASPVSKRVLSEIWIYPVKSLGGIRVSSAVVREKGLLHDRRWMLIDEKGRFITQRSVPAMALFKVQMLESSLGVTFENDFLEVPFAQAVTGLDRPATIWDDAVAVREAPERVHRWFSDRMGFSCRLVAFPESNPRLVDSTYRLAEESVSLADGYPLLIIGQASLDDLNTRLQKPVSMRRFRPNLVFKGGSPYEEDQWRNFRVGKNAMVGVKPCARCVLTTVDPETGNTGKEPLLTLSRYRRKNENIYFGQNVIPVDFGEIHEGDEIFLA